MKTQLISKYVMLGVIAVSAIVFLLFFFVGWDDEYVGDFVAPMFTSLLLFLMYACVLLTAGLTVWSVVKSAQSNKGVDSASYTGVPGGKIIMFTCVITIISLAIGGVLGIGEEDFRAADGTVTTGGWVTVVDMFIWSMYILTLVAIGAICVTMSGYLTKSATKK